MGLLRCLSVALLMAGMLGCTTPQNRKAEADAAIAEEKLQILKEYRACLKANRAEEASEKCAHLERATAATRE
jgi:hypothetical protein